MDKKDYYHAIEDFMREIDGMTVKSLALVALVDDPECYDVVTTYMAGPHELASIAGILTLTACHESEVVNGSVYMTDEEDEHDDDS